MKLLRLRLSGIGTLSLRIALEGLESEIYDEHDISLHRHDYLALTSVMRTPSFGRTTKIF